MKLSDSFAVLEWFSFGVFLSSVLLLGLSSIKPLFFAVLTLIFYFAFIFQREKEKENE